MVSTSYPIADHRRRWQRIELISGAVAGPAVAAFVLLVVFTNVAPRVAFLGILVALGLPVCLDLIWRAGHEDPAGSTVGTSPGSPRRRDAPLDTRASHDSPPRTRHKASPGPAVDRVRRLYDRAAPSYARYRDGWLAVAGSAAEKAMLADLAGALRPGLRVLDAGSGTGAVSRHIRRRCPGVELIMVDLSAAMLEQAGDVGAPRVDGSVVELPFPDDTFDVVVSAWVIETIPDPRQAVTELLRVLAPGGCLLYTFCSRPTDRLVGAGLVPGATRDREVGFRWTVPRLETNAVARLRRVAPPPLSWRPHH